MSHHHHSWTNFTQYNHPQLYSMLYAGDPASVRKAAESWDATGNNLHEQASNLENRLTAFGQEWQGGAADQYKTMVTDLIGGIRKVADTAFAMRDLDHEAADAQDRARAQMPQPVAVPMLQPNTLALANAPIQVDASTPAQVLVQMQQARTAAIAAVQGQQQASAAADAASAQAAAVMQTLAGSYVGTQNAIPPSPDAQTPPNLAAPGSVMPNTTVATPIMANLTSTATGDPSWSLSGNLTDPTSGTTGAVTQKSNPLFGDMFTAGVAAASAAAFGRFGSLIPPIPGFAKKQQDGSTDTPTAAPGQAPKLGENIAAGGMPKLGTGAIGGLGAGIGGSGGVSAGSVPSASAGMIGANPTSALASGVAGAAGMAAGSAAKAAMPMMPMMPMGGMGGSEMGGGRRVPPWLVETEDVWGESSTVSPTVIGEEPDLGPDPFGSTRLG